MKDVVQKGDEGLDLLKAVAGIPQNPKTTRQQQLRRSLEDLLYLRYVQATKESINSRKIFPSLPYPIIRFSSERLSRTDVLTFGIPYSQR